MDEEFLKALALLQIPIIATVLEYRVYYDGEGKILTYTTEDLPGSYLVITQDQYNQARFDALVKDGQLIFTHKQTHVYKLKKNKTTGVCTSKYDVNIIMNKSKNTVYWTQAYYEIK